ncbi:hypothetical protein F5J12DRAFT_930439 [Pisolithus orientalis]|uniref:uncharacterized protein n=1 Tax=Pisolithus orientalis TaxID=936130 RepID=UPI0022246EB6|nr:uncharacterized protein F5J12DRAFT_930439 [Pisolithus orientalis]KAI5984899.1 hypothetical protein F5J12DRAFT_930439 [Pisolithus orientalis]
MLGRGELREKGVNITLMIQPGTASRHSFHHCSRVAPEWLKTQFEGAGEACRFMLFVEGSALNVVWEISRHYDSCGSFGMKRAPGGNDDGSGTISILNSTARRGKLRVRSANIILTIQAECLCTMLPTNFLNWASHNPIIRWDSVSFPTLLCDYGHSYSPDESLCMNKDCEFLKLNSPNVQDQLLTPCTTTPMTTPGDLETRRAQQPTGIRLGPASPLSVSRVTNSARGTVWLYNMFTRMIRNQETKDQNIHLHRV